MARQAVLTPEEIDLLDPTFIGQTCKKDAFGRWVLPNKTFGWQTVGWHSEWLRFEDGGACWAVSAEEVMCRRVGRLP